MSYALDIGLTLGTRCFKDWADDPRNALSFSDLYHRVFDLRWDMERALTTPRLR